MTENTTETRTVQQYRHEARRVLTQAREALALRTEASREVYMLLNGSIESILAGRQGLAQDEQVAHLDEAKTTVEANRAQIEQAVEAARQQIIAQVKAWDFGSALDQAAAILAEAREFAATRDFTAHQERKYRQRSGLSLVPDEDGDDSEED